MKKRFRPAAVQQGRSALSPGAICKYSDTCERCRTGTTGSHVCCTRIEHLSVRAGGLLILDDVNLHIHCGELTAIVGKNGAGKTTLLKALLGEIPREGTVSFLRNGAESATPPRFGYVPQSLAAEAGSPISVRDLILSGLSSYPVWLPRRARDDERIRNVLSVSQAEDLIERRICDLSGGELQRVMLALAIHPLPDILLLDEPVSGADRAGIRLFYDLVSDLRRRCDITIILISHDLDLIARHADRVVLIDRGIAAQGSPQEVYTHPSFTRSFGRIYTEQALT